MNQDDRLGPYRLLRRLGEGGMGVVHLAVDSQGRQVAVKVLRSEVAGDDVARRRLSREVETMRRARSKFIAEVLDADVTGHRPYIVTRYVPGRPLDEIVKEDGPLDLPALIRLAHGVASALSSVHAVGVIHRDLKPGNVLLLDGQPVLIDFGIAQAVDATRLTQTGMFIGTPQYLAPEIIEGHEAGPEVDVHAWAGTLLFAATGQPPFGKGTLEMIFYNITAGKADVSAAPSQLQPLLKAAFQRNPAKRPKAAELAEQTALLMPRQPGVPDEVSTVPRADRRITEAPPMPPAPSGGPYVSLLPGQGQPHAGQPAPHPSGPHQPLQHPGGPHQPVQQSSGPYPPVQHPGGPLPGSHQGTGPGGHQPTGPGGHQPTGPGGHQPTGPGGHQPTGPSGHQATGPGGQHATGPGGQHPSGLQQAPGQAQPYPPQAPHQPGRQQTGPGAGDPFPTRRVSPEEMRQVREEHQQGWPQQAAPMPGYDVPTRRVRTDLPEYGRPPSPYAAQPQTPYPPEPPTKREPYIPSVRPGNALQYSRAYAVTGAMMLIIMIVLAALAPVIVAAVAIPVAVLLRAADLAQAQLAGRRGGGSAALDVLRVFAHPQALLKSLGVTLALTLYAAILGLPVTLLLTVVLKMDSANALAWGVAVALWTVCAGPGVEGPSRQMRRTLASLVPSRQVAMVLAGVLAAVAAGSLWLAYGTADKNSGREANWNPVNVDLITGKLDGLRGGDDG
ncbi:protein kinase [Nonomuraea sp. NPDC050310]|uniref:serine/threonine-protein kinase n=1 Tax=Nonomuraea sp. NPDC050310 TaxID=3154935 RepID=UPI0033E4A142